MAMVFENGMSFASCAYELALSLGIQANSPRLAGGQAVNSHMERMLTMVPEHIHDRSGIFMGSYDEVQKVIDVHQRYIK